MRRALALVAFGMALLACMPSANAATATPIPGTPVQVVELGPTSGDATFGSKANFSWAVFNGGPPTYTMSVTVNASETGLQISGFPLNFTLRRDTLREVRVNLTAPSDGDPRTIVLRVTFSTLAPITSSLQINATLSIHQKPAMIDVLTTFVAVGGIIAIGFAATLIFERTRIPDLLILILLGVLLGPVALAYFGVALIPAASLLAVTPYFAALALMIILFDGGLNLSLLQIVKRLGMVGLHTGMAFLLTVFGVALIASTVLGYPFLVGLLLGAILGGTSSAVVIGIVRFLPVSDDTKVVLTLESVLTDVLCVVSVIALIELLRGGPGASVSIVFIELAQRFGVALILGGFVGVTWLILLRRVEKMPFSYMLTIAILFILYGVTEAAHGSGAMASFVFGLILGNHAELARRFQMQARFVVDERIKQFHSELAFVVRTFFFVFLGLVFTFQFGGSWRVSSGLPVLSELNGTFLLFLVGVLLVFATIIFVRILTAYVTARVASKPRAERRVLWSLMGRGLAAAVLASLPFSVSAFTAPTGSGDQYYHAVMAPYQVQFLNLIFYVIFLTVLATTMGVASTARSLGIRKPQPVQEGTPQLAFWAQWDEELRRMEEPTGPAEDETPPDRRIG